MKTAFLYDVFISYSHRDGEWVRNWLLPRLELENAGLRVCIDFRDFDIGVPSLVNMERAVEHSRKTLLVLTPSWVESEWTNFEALLVQTDDPIGLRRRMLPLMLKQCKPPKRVSIFTHADFTKPDEWEKQLGRIIDAINDKGNLPQAVAVSGTSLIPLPPEPYLAHPYPMPKHWTGRQAEMDQLDAWLKDDAPPMCCLVAIGGMGKSSLAWAWLQRQVVSKQEALGLSGIFQWSFYEGEVSFQRFLEDLSAYLGVSAISDPVTALTQRLSEQRVLLMLDGFERLLCAYAAADAALLPERTAEELEPGERRCIEWTMARFLRSLVAGGDSKVLLTSRFVPEELDGLAGWQPMELSGLDPADAVAYLRANGVKGTRRELQDTAAVYGFHPLSLSKLVEVLHYDIHQPDDIRQAPRYDVTLNLKARQHHILERAYETLPHELGQFLSALAALRGKATMEVARFLAADWSDAELSVSLRRLEEDRWVLWDREQRTLDFHPVVRRYVYARLEDKLGTHTRLVDYFHPLADKVDTEAAESIADLAPVIEFYHHTVGASRYDGAQELYRDRLARPLYFRFGAYQACIELLRALFPDDENRPPRLKDQSAQAWALNEMSNAYALSGRPHPSMRARELALAINEQQGDKRRIATDLGNLANRHIEVGDLAAAEQSLQRRIELCREIGDTFRKAIGHQQLGRLLAYRGAFADAQEEIGISIAYCEKARHQQGYCQNMLTLALGTLLINDAKAALEAARRARELADARAYENDIIQAEWLLGAAHRALGHLPEAESHLTEALTRCRRINLVELEPDILLEMARLRWAQAQGDEVTCEESTRLREEALGLAREALAIADRCEYRLKQADVHNFLAQVALEKGDREEAMKHAEIAKERAWCDGPPYCYKPALEEAERILESLTGGNT
jgi:tetratricopeptide (TPR) repeat protein